LLVTGERDRWSSMTETLLMYAARRDHIERLIAPALARGAVVICDRYIDSTRAYQGAAGGVASDLIKALEAATLDKAWPDLTLIFDLPVEVGLARAASRSSTEVRFEAMDLQFHRRLRDGFLDIARGEPERCATVDASADVQTVSDRIWAIVEPRLFRR
jgi:dTMP kinase